MLVVNDERMQPRNGGVVQRTRHLVCGSSERDERALVKVYGCDQAAIPFVNLEWMPTFRAAVLALSMT